MTSFTRKSKRKKSVQLKKQLKKNLKSFSTSVEKSLDAMPKKCMLCKRDFDIKRDAANWMMKIDKGSNHIKLFCPECFRRIENDNS